MRAIVGIIVAMATPAFALEGSGVQEEPPKRVVSLHLCADEWLLLLAAPGQIAALTWLASDPGLTRLAARATSFARHGGGAEAIVRLAPDLVLNVRGAAPQTVALLRRFGVRVVEFDIPRRLADIDPTLRLLAAQLGRVDAGERLAEHLRQQLAGEQPGPSRPRAAVYQARGYNAGAEMLVHDILTAAGLENIAAPDGAQAGTYLPLAALVMARPAVLVMGRAHPGRPSMAEDLFAHPLLEREIARRDIEVLPPQPWSCGTPMVGDAVVALRAAAGSVR